MYKLNKFASIIGRGLNQCGNYNDVSTIAMGTSIPQVVHQSYPSKTLPIEIQNNIDLLKSINPNWKFKLYDDHDIQAYIETYFPKLVGIYKKINPKYGAARVDFFRYLLIYNEGGIYLDIKSSLSKPLNEIIHADDKYLLSHWQNDTGQPYEKSGFYVDLKNKFGEFQQWHIASVKGHPFLKAVIENVCNNIKNYSPFLHHTGEIGVLRVTGPIAYTMAITKHLEYYPHRLVRSNVELNFVYSIFTTNRAHKHHFLFKTHYSKLNEPVVNSNYFINLLFKTYQPFKDYLVILNKKVFKK